MVCRDSGWHQCQLFLRQVQDLPAAAVVVALGEHQQAPRQALRGRQQGHLFQGDECQAQLVAHQQGHVAPVMRLAAKQFEQRRLRYLE